MDSERQPGLGSKQGNEPFTMDGVPLAVSVLDFWRWSASDLLSNTLRGLVAEYLVSYALGATTTPRIEWASYDVITPKGVKIEVKSSAYLQSWPQSRPSRLSFSIAPAKGWDSDANTTSATPRRPADVYVFAVLAHRDRATVNPLDIDQWKFHVIGRDLLDRHLGAQRTVTPSTLQRIGAQEAHFVDLAQRVDRFAQARLDSS